MTQRRRTFMRARALLIGALVLGFGASATMAAWTDNEFAITEITAGTFTIQSRTAASPNFAEHNTAEQAVALQLNATNLYPGQSRAAWIQITTNGTVPGTVQLTGAEAPVNDARGTALSDALRVRIIPSTAAAGTTPSNCNASITDGGVVYTGAGTLPTLTPQSLQANGGNVVNYCVIVTVPTDTPSSAQGGVVTPTWTFTGTTG